MKPNNAGIILHYRSAHPKNTKLNTLRSQFRRAARLSSDEDAKLRSFTKIRNLFLKNGYPSHVLKSVQRQVERSTESRVRARDIRVRAQRGVSAGEGRQGEGRTRSRRGANERGGGGQRRAGVGEGGQGEDRPDREPGGVLLLPYVNETVLCKVKRVARNSGLSVSVASYTPDTLKRHLVNSSLTDPPCPSGNRTCHANVVQMSEHVVQSDKER